MAKGFPDFTGPKVGVYLQPEWAAKEGVDKNLWASDSNKARGEYSQLAYEVPAGFTLYITQVTALSKANLAEDSDNNQMCYAAIAIEASFKYYIGANGGGMWTLTKPLVVAAGNIINVFCINAANHNCDLRGGIGGYEVPA